MNINKDIRKDAIIAEQEVELHFLLSDNTH